MKLAICLKGHMRTMSVMNSIKELQKHHDVDIYIHTYDEVGTKSASTGTTSPKKGTILPNSGKIDPELVNQVFSPKKIKIETYEEVEPILDEITEKSFYNWMPTNSVYPNTILSQIRQRALCIDLIEDVYDYIIVTRPDVVFQFTNPNLFVENDYIGITETNARMYNHPDGGVWFDDLVLIGTQETVKRISNFYYNIESILQDLQDKGYLGIAKCMHQIQSYAFEHHLDIKLIGIDGLYSRIA